MGLSPNRREIAKKWRRNGVRWKIIAPPRGWRCHRNQAEASEWLKTRGSGTSRDDSSSERNILTTHLAKLLRCRRTEARNPPVGSSPAGEPNRAGTPDLALAASVRDEASAGLTPAGDGQPARLACLAAHRRLAGAMDQVDEVNEQG